MKYLVRQKDFKGRLSIKVSRQKRLNQQKKETLGKKNYQGYITKMLYEQGNRNFEMEYLKKLGKIGRGKSQFFQRKNLERKVMSEFINIDSIISLFFSLPLYSLAFSFFFLRPQLRRYMT